MEGSSDQMTIFFFFRESANFSRWRLLQSRPEG